MENRKKGIQICKCVQRLALDNSRVVNKQWNEHKSQLRVCHFHQIFQSMKMRPQFITWMQNLDCFPQTLSHFIFTRISDGWKWDTNFLHRCKSDCFSTEIWMLSSFNFTRFFNLLDHWTGKKGRQVNLFVSQVAWEMFNHVSKWSNHAKI